MTTEPFTIRSGTRPNIEALEPAPWHTYPAGRSAETGAAMLRCRTMSPPAPLASDGSCEAARARLIEAAAPDYINADSKVGKSRRCRGTADSRRRPEPMCGAALHRPGLELPLRPDPRDLLRQDLDGLPDLLLRVRGGDEEA